MGENVTQTVPFFGVRDIDASLRFYVDGLGFRKTKEWIDDGKLRWCWLERGGGALMLQEFSGEGIPTSPLGVGVSINFICEDAIALFHEFRGRDLNPSIPFVGNGLWVTHLADPDGYPLYFESPTDAPEESVYNPASL
jgi:lactoylglutathione lyase